MKKQLFFLTAVLVMMPILVLGQEGVTVEGTVTDDFRTPLAGANVFIKGTAYGAASNVDGKFSFTLPAGMATGQEVQLGATFIGYRSAFATITLSPGITTQAFMLEPDVLFLEEIVTIGYGTARKEALTGSVVSISAKRLEQLPTTTFQDVIQGTPGVQVQTNDGAPGAGISIRIRGVGSITAGSEPLYVVDGIPMMIDDIGRTGFDNPTGRTSRTANALASINPNDIESLVVLKDAASTAIYGSRGANGVVLITTKGGVAGTDIFASGPKFEVKIQRGYSDFAHGNLLEGLSGDQYHAYFIEANVNRGRTVEESEQQYQDTFPLLSKGFGNTNWLDEITRTGATSSFDMSAIGGGGRYTYFVSGSYFDQQGNVETIKFERYSSRINLTAQLTDKFSLANNLNVSYTNQRAINDGSAWEAPFYMAVFMPPAVPVFNEEGEFYGAHQDKNIMGGNNPLGGLVENPKKRETTRIQDHLSANYQFNDNISFTSSWSFDIYELDDYAFFNARYGGGRNSGGEVNEARSDNITWQGTQTINYNNTFSAVHSLSTVVGYEANKSNRDRVELWGEGFAHPDLQTANSAALIASGGSDRDRFSFESMFARVNYDYNKKYYFSGSFRRDGSSRFGPDNRWGNFWAAGFGYTVTEEAFMDDITFVDYLKFRTSYGQVGNAAIGNFEWQGLYGFSLAYDGAPAAAPSQVPNTALTWESQGNFNIGFDYVIMDNRLSGTVDWYKKTSSDLLLDVPISYTTGFTSVLQNFGDMENSGLEFSMQAEVIRKRDFNLALNFNVTSINNELTRLSSPFIDGTKRREEGRDYQEYYLLPWAGVDPDNGKPLYYTDDTKTATTSLLSETDRIYDGKSATPDFIGSFGFSGQFKRFTFSVAANYTFGNYLFENAARFYHGDGRYAPRSTSTWEWENRWQKPGDNAKVPQIKWGGNSGSQPSNSDRYLQKGDYIRLKNVRLAYRLPESFASFARVGSLDAYVTLTNYFTWVSDDDLHFDPEQVINGVYNTGTPNSKTISFGWNIGF